MSRDRSADELLPDVWFERFRGWVRDHLGIDFPGPRRLNLSNGIARAMHESGASDYAAYWEQLNDADQCLAEFERLARLLTVTETYFFRDELQMRALQSAIFPRLIASCEATHRLTIWSAGCASGEEPYSLAMVLCALLSAAWEVSIYATDINPQALEQARHAVYKPASLREVPPAMRDQFFHELPNNTFQLSDTIRKHVKFSALNLADSAYPPPFGMPDQFDLIVCRNVLMYFADAQATAIVERLHRALAPDGLFISSQVEQINRLDGRFYPLMLGDTVVYQKNAPAKTRSVSAVVINDPALKSSPDRKQTPVSPARPRRAPVDKSAYEQALARANAGDWEAALRLCKQAVSEKPVDYRTHQLLGLICEARGDLLAAREAYRRAIYLSPDSLLAHFYLANVYHRLGDRREARVWLTLYQLLENRLPDERLSDNPELTIGYMRSLIAARVEAKRPTEIR